MAEMQKCMGYKSETVDGYTNFVFLTTGGSVLMPGRVDRTIRLIIKAYNDQETKKAKKSICSYNAEFVILLFLLQLQVTVYPQFPESYQSWSDDVSPHIQQRAIHLRSFLLSQYLLPGRQMR